jgi:hypothetical protein
MNSNIKKYEYPDFGKANDNPTNLLAALQEANVLATQEGIYLHGSLPTMIEDVRMIISQTNEATEGE